MATKSQKKATKVEKVTSETSLSERKSSFAENYGSTILGFIVVLILGSFLFNVFRGNNKKNNGEVGSGEGTQQEEQANQSGRTHTVAKGEDLWKISEKYYNSGYNWTDIAKANNITDPNTIEEGQSLVIPNVTPAITEAPTIAAQATKTPEPTSAPSIVPTKEETQPTYVQPTQAALEETKPVSGEYTIVKGDSLWSIAVKQYNNGYKWTEIAQANKLTNPNLIHSGNKLVLP